LTSKLTIRYLVFALFSSCFRPPFSRGGDAVPRQLDMRLSIIFTFISQSTPGQCVLDEHPTPNSWSLVLSVMELCDSNLSTSVPFIAQVVIDYKS
jgi:hypothetical protein